MLSIKKKTRNHPFNGTEDDYVSITIVSMVG